MSADPNTIQAQLDALQRRRDIAQSLAQENAQPQQMQVINGRVMDQGFAPLVRGLSSILANTRANNLTKQMTDLTGKKNQALITRQNDAISMLAGPQAAPQTSAPMPIAPQSPQMSSQGNTVADQFATPQMSQAAPAPQAPAPYQPPQFGDTLRKANVALAAGVNPEMVKAYLAQANTAANPDPKTDLGRLTSDFNHHLISQDQFDKEKQDLAEGPDSKRIPLIQEYEYAKSQGFKGSLMDYKKQAGSGGFDQGSVENTAQMIANNQIPMLSGFALKTPWGQGVISRVKQINPEYDANAIGIRKTAENQFSSGKLGNTVRSLNVATSHLDTLGTLADALNNKDTQLFNKLGNAWSAQTGNPAPTNFDAAKRVVADEVVKAIVGTGGGVADREEAAKSISSAQSPAQLKQVIQTYKTLMSGQLHGLQTQYEQSTGKKDFNRFISGEAQTQLEGGQQHPADIQSLLDKYK